MPRTRRYLFNAIATARALLGPLYSASHANMQHERVDQMQTAVLSLDHSVALVALAHKQGMLPDRFFIIFGIVVIGGLVCLRMRNYRTYR